LTNESFYSSYIKGERSLAEDIFIKLTIIFFNSYLPVKRIALVRKGKKVRILKPVSKLIEIVRYT